MRKVVLKLTTQKDLINHESSASTFGELKKEMRQVKWSGMRVVERASKATLQMDDAVLPQGDFILFLVPEKVKSGRKTSGGTEELSKPIDECKYNELRSHISWLNREKGAGLDMSGGTPELQKALKKYYKKSGIAEAVTGVKAKAEAKAKTAPKAAPKAKVAEYIDTPREDDEDDEDYADRLAFEKKSFDKKEKKRLAKLEEERIAKEKEEKEAAEKEAAAKKPSKDNSEKVKKAKKKGIFGFGGNKDKGPTDPLEIIEESRQRMNLAIDEIVKSTIEGNSIDVAPLQFTADDLEKEIKRVHSALRTSRSSAKYID